MCFRHCRFNLLKSRRVTPESHRQCAVADASPSETSHASYNAAIDHASIFVKRIVAAVSSAAFTPELPGIIGTMIKITECAELITEAKAKIMMALPSAICDIISPL